MVEMCAFLGSDQLYLIIKDLDFVAIKEIAIGVGEAGMPALVKVLTEKEMKEIAIIATRHQLRILAKLLDFDILLQIVMMIEEESVKYMGAGMNVQMLDRLIDALEGNQLEWLLHGLPLAKITEGSKVARITTIWKVIQRMPNEDIVTVVLALYRDKYKDIVDIFKDNING